MKTRKNILFLICSLFLLVMAVSCGSRGVLSEVEGSWELVIEDAQLNVDILDDGTALISMSGQLSPGQWVPIIKDEKVDIRCEGEDLYLTTTNGEEFGHLYVRDGKLYSDDNRPFTRVH